MSRKRIEETATWEEATFDLLGKPVNRVINGEARENPMSLLSPIGLALRIARRGGRGMRHDEFIFLNSFRSCLTMSPSIIVNNVLRDMFGSVLRVRSRCGRSTGPEIIHRFIRVYLIDAVLTYRTCPVTIRRLP